MKCRRSNSIDARSIVFRLGLLIYICGVAWLCFANFNKLPDVQKSFWGIPTDKLVHFCMFFPFPFLGYYAYDRRAVSTLQTLATVICICSFGCIFAGITEVVQGSLPYRSEDIKDFGADCLSICLSSLTVFVINICKIKKK